MLEPVKHILNSKRIVLASSSPRRKQIIENVGLKVEVIASQFEENLDKSAFQHPYEYALETARWKAIEVYKRLMRDEKKPDIVIAADTVVAMDNQLFEKPSNQEHAFEMLSGFSGRTHTVYTGVNIIYHKKTDNQQATDAVDDFELIRFHESTDVTFAKIPPETIRAYIETGEPMDKAGGYGIQAAGGTLIESIHGDYFNVMGFPLCKVAKALVDIVSKSY